MVSAFFQGTSPVLPIFVIILIFFVCLAVSWWSYRQFNTISFWKKTTLIALRGSVFSILVLMLFNPFRAVDIVDENRPVIAVYLDNSQSTSVERGEYNGLDEYRRIFEEFNSSKNSDFDYETYLFSDEITEGDSIDASGSSTNLQAVMQHIREQSSPHVASVLISDGIFNRGSNPQFSAQNFSSPLFTIPLGDTSTVRDVFISELIYNETTYTNTRERFEIDVQQMGFEDEEANIQFIVNGDLEDSQTLSFSTDRSSHLIDFSREFAEPGFYTVELNIPPKEEEFTDRNNSRSFTVEVIDDKTRILSLAFEVHPDVRSLRNLIATDRQNELTAATWLGDGRYIGDDPTTDDTEYDLLVLHGLPDPGSAISEWLEEQDVPLLFLTSPDSYSKLNSDQLSGLTNLSLSQPQTLLDVQIQPWDSEISHPLLELENSYLSRFPTVQTYRGNYNTSPVSEVLLTAQFQRNATDIPLLIVEDTPSGRRATLNAFGWYRLEQNRLEEARFFHTRFFSNLVNWTATSPDRRNLTVYPRKESFTENEPVEIRATLTNERGEPEPDGSIEIRFFDDNNGEERVFRMNPLEAGEYSVQIGSYPEGIYQIEGTAIKDNREIGTDESRVHITESSLELIETKRNDALLQNIAGITGGLFISDFNFSRIYSHLQELDLNQVSSDERTEYNYLHRSPWWFAVILILLSAEWILRRTLSLP